VGKILNGTAAVITAITGLLGLTLGFFGGAKIQSTGSGPFAAPVVTVTMTKVVSSGPQSTTVAPQPTSPPSDPAVQWHGDVIITDGATTDLDTIPPSPSGFSGDISVVNSDTPEFSISGNDVASTPDGTGATLASCSTYAKTRTTMYVSVKKGDQFCVLTDDGRIAVGKVNSWTPGTGQAGVTLTIWAKS
jgi:hypothetical protein